MLSRSLFSQHTCILQKFCQETHRENASIQAHTHVARSPVFLNPHAAEKQKVCSLTSLTLPADFRYAFPAVLDSGSTLFLSVLSLHLHTRRFLMKRWARGSFYWGRVLAVHHFSAFITGFWQVGEGAPSSPCTLWLGCCLRECLRNNIYPRFSALRFPPTSAKHVGMGMSDSKLPRCEWAAKSRVYFCVPTTLTGMKMNTWMMDYYSSYYSYYYYQCLLWLSGFWGLAFTLTLMSSCGSFFFLLGWPYLPPTHVELPWTRILTYKE